MCLALAMSGTAAAASPAQGPVAFYPASVTFVSLRTGWALGGTTCGQSTCLALQKTDDGGRSWSSEALPASLVSAANRWPEGEFMAGTALNVRFADPRDGWIYGFVRAETKTGVQVEAALWSTHNGGASWAPVDAPGLSSPYSSILDLEASGGRAYMLIQVGDTVELQTSGVGRDAWAAVRGPHFGLPAGGSNLSGAIVLQGSTGWVVEGNDRGATGAARLVDGRWLAWTPPCADVGGTLAFPAAAGPGFLAAVCVMGGFASPLSPYAPAGATVGSSWLYQSANGGATFSPVAELGGQGQTVGEVIASPSPGVVFLSRSSSSEAQLLATFDSGSQWADVYHGTFSYLGFTSPDQGVAIVASGSRTAMIMTYDGGHHWQKVNF